jgi:hypothetical protein
MFRNLIAPSFSSHETVLFNNFCDPVVVLFDVYVQHITILLLQVNGILIYCQNLTGMQSLVSLFEFRGRARDVAV